MKNFKEFSIAECEILYVWKFKNNETKYYTFAINDKEFFKVTTQRYQIDTNKICILERNIYG